MSSLITISNFAQEARRSRRRSLPKTRSSLPFSQVSLDHNNSHPRYLLLTLMSSESEKSIAQKVADDTQAAVGSAKETVSNLVNTAAEKVQAAGKQSPPF